MGAFFHLEEDMALTILNDWHLGCIRSGGVTPQTAYQLRQDLLAEFEEQLYGIDTDLMILGDLFDTWDVSKADLLQTYRLLDAWLVRTGKSLYAIAGNHDTSRNSTNLSSFQFLCALLSAEGAYAGQVHTLQNGGMMTPYGYAISHVQNQDAFNVELAKVPECDYCFLHVNFDNKFATESDHSLNLSQEQAAKLPVKCVVLAHEHVHRIELGGRVVIIGNQRPSSVSDALNNKVKYRMEINDAGKHSLVQTWKAEGDFYEVDWRDLKDEGRFIRVVGNATAAEADQVVTAISRFRQTAKALIITNAARIEGLNDQDEITLTFEQITAFNVRDELRAMLTDDENQRIDKLELNHA